MAVFIMNAIHQTIYYRASHTGLLPELLENRFVSEKLSIRLRQLVLAGTLIIIIGGTILSLTYVTYVMFFSDNVFDFVLAPVTVHGTLSEPLLITVRLFYLLIVQAQCFQVWYSVHCMTTILQMTIQNEFDSIYDRFQKSIDHRGRLRGDIKMLRKRHDAVCQAVNMADSFIRYNNAASMTCELLVIVIVLYSSTFIGYTTAIFGSMYEMTVSGYVVGLTVTVVNGICVNTAVSVSKLYLLLFECRILPILRSTSGKLTCLLCVDLATKRFKRGTREYQFYDSIAMTNRLNGKFPRVNLENN